MQELDTIALQLQEVIKQPVEVKIQFGVLVITVYSISKSICDPIIEKLNQIKPDRMHIQIVGRGWNKMYKFSDGVYTANSSDTSLGFILIILGVGAIAALVWTSFSYQRPVPANVTENNPNASRVFLSRSDTGYELWLDKTCIIVKNSKESDIKALGTDLQGFKNFIKSQTGYKCVLFE